MHQAMPSMTARSGDDESCISEGCYPNDCLFVLNLKIAFTGGSRLVVGQQFYGTQGFETW